MSLRGNIVWWGLVYRRAIGARLIGRWPGPAPRSIGIQISLGVVHLWCLLILDRWDP